MPLRDHFRSPLDDCAPLGRLSGSWPVMIVASLRRKLPHRYFAEPRVHSGRVPRSMWRLSRTKAKVSWRPATGTERRHRDSGVGTAATDARRRYGPAGPGRLRGVVYDEKRHCRLVAAVEIVSPANKDRPEHRRAFVSKCAGLLRERVSVVIVDVVTTRTQNLYGELLDLIGQSDPGLSPEPPPLYSAACRLTKRANEWLLETWAQSLVLGRPLPTVPLWLADNLAVPLELEESYEQSCSILNIP